MNTSSPKSGRPRTFRHWLRSLSFACCALFALTMVSGCDVDDVLAEFFAQLSPTQLSSISQDKIAIERSGGISLVNTDGTGLTQITDNGKNPDLSPDGTKLAFVRGSSELWMVSLADGGEPKKLFTSLGFISAPAWAPDNNRLAFVQNRGTKDIYVMDTTVTNAQPTQITGVRTFNEGGRFFADNHPGEPTSIFTRALQTREPTIGFQENIAKSNFANNFDPTWSPDGAYIAFVSDRVKITAVGEPQQRTFNDNEIYKIRLSDKAEVRLTDKAREVFNSASATLPYPLPLTLTAPNWSPSGAFIVFATAPQSASFGGAYRIDANFRGSENLGSHAKDFFRLSTSNQDSHPYFSPDNNRIALARNGMVYIRANDNNAESGTHPLMAISTGAYPSWRHLQISTYGYAVIGHVQTASGAAIGNATVSLTGNGISKTTNTTTGSGLFIFEGIPAGHYTVSVTLAGYTFSPPSKPVSVSSGPSVSNNFIGTPKVYTIQGSLKTGAGLPIAQNTVSLTPNGSTSQTIVQSNDAGAYFFGGIAPGTYTVRPGTDRYTFAPTTLTVGVTNSDKTGNNFVGTARTFSISGDISGTLNGTNYDEIEIQLLQGTSIVKQMNVSAASYALSGILPGTYTLNAVSTKYSFSPASYNITVASANLSGYSFAARPLAGTTVSVMLKPVSGFTASVVHRSKIGADINPNTFIAGDHDADGDFDGKADGVIEGFVSYDLSSVPSGSIIKIADFAAQQLPRQFEGNPYGFLKSNDDLGDAFVEQVYYSSINGQGDAPLSLDLLDENALGTGKSVNPAVLSTDMLQAVKHADVKTIVQSELNAGKLRAQFRLRFRALTNNNGKVDYAYFTPGNLSLTYQVPSTPTAPADTAAPHATISSPANGATLDLAANKQVTNNGVQGTASDNVMVTGVTIELAHHSGSITSPITGYWDWTGRTFVATSSSATRLAAHSTDNFATWTAGDTNVNPFPALTTGNSYAVIARASDAAGNVGTARVDFSRAEPSNALLATLTTSSLPQGVAVNEKTNRIYVACSGAVDVFNGANNAKITTVTLDNFPDAVAVNTATNKIYVSGFFGTRIIDGATNTELTAPKALHDLGGSISHIAVNPDPDGNPATNDSRLYLTNTDVYVIDGATDGILKQIPVGITDSQSDAYGIDINLTTNKIYVAIFGNETNGAKNGSVAVINGATGTLIKNIVVSLDTPDVAVNAATNKVYVTSRHDNNLTIINGSTDTKTGSIDTGFQTETAVVNAVTNRVYVSQGARVVNGANDSLLGHYDLGKTSRVADDVAVNSGTNRIYCVNKNDNSLSVIDGSVSPAGGSG